MKKVLILICMILSIFIISGCTKMNKETVLKKMNNKLSNSNGYHITSELELMSGDDVYKYDVIVSYMKKDYYRVSLMNTINNHEQIILKNKTGVYVLSPNLNKSFKFQSNWPYSNSQAYLPSSVINDLRSDKNTKMIKNKNNYVFTSKVNYKNSSNLTHQEVVVSKDLVVKKVTVFDEDENVQMRVVYKTIDNNAKFKKNYFAVENNMDVYSKNESENKEVSKLDEAIYPMYLPEGTYLDNEKVVDLSNGSRIILTFAGDNPFMLVEQTIARAEDFEIIPTSGDIDMGTLGVTIVDDTSVNWVSGDVEYYLVSSTLPNSELLQVANSISTVPVSK